jgi:glutamine synthetase
MYATFMAKPMAKEPGSAMHLHQSIVDAKTRKNIFSNPTARPRRCSSATSPACRSILPAAMSLFASNVNSYRRISRYSSAPINVHWGYDNRTAGLRVPMSGPDARRVENRVGGADANPYLAIAASLACGYSRHDGGLKPSEPIAGSAYDLAIALPRTLAEALRLLRESKPLVDVRRSLRAGLHGGQGSRVRDLRAGHQFLGARALAAERVARKFSSAGPVARASAAI